MRSKKLIERTVGVTVLLIIAAMVVMFILSGQTTSVPKTRSLPLAIPAAKPFPKHAQPVTQVIEQLQQRQIDAQEIPEPVIKVVKQPHSQPKVQTHHASNAPKKLSKKPTTWLIQVASFSEHKNASDYVKKLQHLGYNASVKKQHTQHAKIVYKVLVGPLKTQQQAQRLRAKLQKTAHVKGILLKN